MNEKISNNENARFNKMRFNEIERKSFTLNSTNINEIRKNENKKFELNENKPIKFDNKKENDRKIILDYYFQFNNSDNLYNTKTKESGNTILNSDCLYDSINKLRNDLSLIDNSSLIKSIYKDISKNNKKSMKSFNFDDKETIKISNREKVVNSLRISKEKYIKVNTGICENFSIHK